MCVGHCFQGREGFGGDDEQRFLCVEIACCLGKIGTVDIGNKAESQVALGVVAQGLVGHHWAQIGPADADIDHIADRFAGIAFPVSAAHAVREVSHLVQDGMDQRHDVYSIYENLLLFRSSQSDMQDCPLLGNVDLFPAKHRIDARPQAGLFGEFEQQPNGLFGNAVLRVVEVDADRLNGEALPALGVLREQCFQIQVSILRGVSSKRLPGRAMSKGCNRCCHVLSAPEVCCLLVPVRELWRQNP